MPEDKVQWYNQTQQRFLEDTHVFRVSTPDHISVQISLKLLQ